MILIALAAAVTLAQPAPAEKMHVYRTNDVSAALAAGCKVQQVHSPAGKITTERAIARCPAPVPSLATGLAQ